MCLAALPQEAAGTRPLARPLVIWLIPAEPAAPDAGIGVTSDCATEEPKRGTLPARIEEQIDNFNASLAGTGVTVINTQERFKPQLVDWSPEMAVPNWTWVRSQVETLGALTRFAAASDVDIQVRFITWDRALSDLRAAWDNKGSFAPPDVVQIGSTWSGQFEGEGLLASKPGWDVDRGGWSDVSGTRACVLPYVDDVHLIFYWKRLPGSPASSDAFQMRAGSWEAIMASIAAPREGGPPFAFPIGLTLNLLHDYASLVWAGGAELLPQTLFWHRLELTSEKASHIPDYIARHSVVTKDGRPRRLVAFPEASHEEVARSFVQGLYRASIEPANFISRWKRDFVCRYGKKGSVSFWDYAAVAVPPAPFRGGSYLAVWSRSAVAQTAFKLAEFLTTDDRYTKMLGGSGYLPSRRPGQGLDLFFGSSEVGSGERDFGNVVQQALSPNVAHTYPPVRDFSAVLESREVLERMQIVWRRTSEQNPEALRAALKDVEEHVNQRIYAPSRVYRSLANISVVVLPVLTGLLGALLLINRWRMTALEQIARLRGLSYSGTLVFDTTHGIFHNPLAEKICTGPKEATKAAMIVAALQGWRRGRDERNWSEAKLGDVIWKAVVLALDSAVSLGVYKEWEESRQPASDFIERWRKGPPPLAANRLCLEISFPRYRRTQLPFLLEHALVCLLQNAMTAVLNPGFRRDVIPRITIHADSDQLCISNPGMPLDKSLCEAINNSLSPKEFEQRIYSILSDPEVKKKPGFGLVEAYCILSQSFGGLRVAYNEPRFEVGLMPESWFWRLTNQFRKSKQVTVIIESNEDVQAEAEHA